MRREWLDQYRCAERRLFDYYGLRARSRSVVLEPLELRIRLWECGEGPPVVFVIGGEGIGALWTPLIARLGGLNAIVVDRPSAGLSETFDYRNADLRAHAITFLDSLLDALHLETCPLVCNSLGGLWSFWFALDRPKRVMSLVQIGCPALFLGSAPMLLRLLATPAGNALMAARRPTPVAARALLTRLGEGRAAKELPTEFLELYGLARYRPATRAAWRALLGGLLSLRGPRLPLTQEQLAEVSQRTLFLWGDREPYAPSQHATRACTVMPNAMMQLVPGGHLPWLDDPSACAATIIRFLGEEH